MGKNREMIAIYSRKSKFTGKGESIGNQVELCRNYVRNLFGEEYAERCVVFEDEGFSGGNLKRPDFQKMMEQVRSHRFRAIVVYRLDRISRNISDFAALIDELTKLEVAFISIREQFDTSTPMGRAMMFIISVFSQLERETIAERIRDNMQELAKTGRWLGGNVPTGLRSEPVSWVTPDGKTRKSFQLVPVPEEAHIPKLIFDLYAQEDSLTAVEAELLRRRIRTRQGKDFTRFAIKGILQNPVYMVADAAAYDYFTAREADVCFPREAFDGSCGIMAYNRTDQEKGRTTVLNPIGQWIIAVGKHPGLVPSEQWIRTQMSLERNKSRSYRKARSNEALLTGLLFCSCGERMYPKLSQRLTREGTAAFSYVCKMKERSKGERCKAVNVNGNLLDAAVLGQVRSLPEDDGHFIRILEKSQQFHSWDREKSQRTKMRTEQIENEKILNGLIDSLAMVEDPVSKSQILKRMKELFRINQELDDCIRKLESAPAAGGSQDRSIEILVQRLVSFSSCVEDMKVTQKRELLRSIVSCVIWDGTNARLVLSGAEVKDMQKPPCCADDDVLTAS